MLQEEHSIGHVPLLSSEGPLPADTPRDTGQSVAALAPFFLSEAFGPIPEKLVKKQALEFIDMGDLLPDNLELKRREETDPAKDNGLANRKRTREVTQQLTWVQCFTTYVAIVSASHPEKYKDLLAYIRLIVREAQRHGTDGWRQSDVMFRKYAASHPSVCWGQPLPSMYATFFLASSPASTPCEHCLEGDHLSSQCALSPYPPPSSFHRSG